MKSIRCAERKSFWKLRGSVTLKSFEYKGMNFTPYHSYRTSAFNNIDNLSKYEDGLFYNDFSHDEFYRTAIASDSQNRMVDVFQCVEDKKLYTPMDYCLCPTIIKGNE